MSAFHQTLRCAWHPDRLDPGKLTLVAVVEQNSGPGWHTYACGQCLEEQRLIPFDEHPPESMGGLRTYPPGAPR